MALWRWVGALAWCLLSGGSAVTVRVASAPIAAPTAPKESQLDSWPLDTCPPAAEAGCADDPGKLTAAVYLVGIKHRLLLNSTMRHVIRRLVDDGFSVHVYASLVFDTSGTGNWVKARRLGLEDPSISPLSRDGLRRHLHTQVHSAGACLVCAEVPERPEPLPPIPPNTGQLWQFPPRSTRTGRRLLNLWLRRERLWNATLQREKALQRRYDFLMWVRDDALWVADIARPSGLLRARSSARTVWTRSCGAWGGLNDKVAMFGRDAAPTMLTLYSSFLHGGFPKRTKNSEEYLLAATTGARLVLERTRFEVQPSVEAMLYGSARQPSVCLLKMYWCGGDRRKYHLSAAFCEEVEGGGSGGSGYGSRADGRALLRGGRRWRH